MDHDDARRARGREQVDHQDAGPPRAGVPGKRTRTQRLPPGPRAAPAAIQAHGRPTDAPAPDHDAELGQAWWNAAVRPDLHPLPVQRKQAGGAAGEPPAPAPARGGGHPMPEAVRARMEQSFGADFSGVRIHHGPQATAAGALAYARGSEIHFAPGQYDPDSERGQRLLGHELAHVVQQAEGRVPVTAQAKGTALNDDPSLEREADELGARAARGERATRSATAVVAARASAACSPIQRAEQVQDVNAANNNALIGGVGELHELQQAFAAGAVAAGAVLGHLQRMGPGQRALVRADAGLMAQILGGRTSTEIVSLVAMLGFPSVNEEVQELANRLGPAALPGLVLHLKDGAIAAAIDASFAHSWSSWHEMLPAGAAMPPRVRTELFAWAHLSKDATRIRQVMERRFGVQITREWGVDDWPADALLGVWRQLDQLPTAHVSQNAMLQAIKRVAAKDEGGRVAVSGNTPTYDNVASRIEVGFRDEDVTEPDDGRYTTAQQPLRDVALLPATVAHEIAHTQDLSHGYTDAGGAFRTQVALGAWRIHSDGQALLTILLGHFPDPGAEHHDAIKRGLEGGRQVQVPGQDGPGTLIAFVNDGRRAARPQPAHRNDNSRVCGGRYYYQGTYQSYWTSYDVGIRQNHGPSNYAYEDVKDFFAEIYALYYSTPDPGSAVRAWNQGVYDWFTTQVDRGYSTRKI